VRKNPRASSTSRAAASSADPGLAIRESSPPASSASNIDLILGFPTCS